MLGCVIMAAGAGTRFSGNKLLASLGDAVVVERTIRSVPPVFETVVVTRWPEVRVRAEAAGVRCVAPAGAERSASVRAGLAAGAARWDGCVFLSGDQPLVRPESLEALAAAHRAEPERVLRLSYGGVMAAPVLFPRRLFAALSALTGADGGRSLLAGEDVRAVEAFGPEELFDIDTRADLVSVRAALSAGAVGVRPRPGA